MKIGSHKLFSKDKTTIEQVLITHCGNFVLLGCQSGVVDVYNMQSGLFQNSFSPIKGHNLESEENNSIVGLACTIGNRHLITASVGGRITIWDYEKHTRIVSWMPSDKGNESEEKSHRRTIVRCAFLMENNLFAVAFDSGDILVYDIDHIVANSPFHIRKFAKAHVEKIQDLCFRSDGKWLLSCSPMEKCVIVWDLVSGQERTRCRSG